MKTPASVPDNGGLQRPVDARPMDIPKVITRAIYIAMLLSWFLAGFVTALIVVAVKA